MDQLQQILGDKQPHQVHCKDPPQQVLGHEQLEQAHQQAEAGGESTVSIHGENGINDGHLGMRASALFANAAADLRCAETQ